jgi:hypothetical protein
MSLITHCHECLAEMSDNDHAAESVEQDCLCIKCREARFKSSEEDAIAAFCAGRPRLFAEWFSNIIAGCGFEFKSRYPVDKNEHCHRLIYSHQGYSLEFMGRTVTLQPTNKDWCIEFYIMTPNDIILAAIKAATANS